MHKPSPLIPDTHVWIWLVDGTVDRISAPVLARISSAASTGRLFVSALSVWEIGMLQSKRRITLSAEITVWVQRALALPGLNLAHLTTEIALDSAILPGAIQWSLADGFIIATARSFNATLVTVDPSILEYSKSGHVKTLNAEA